MDVCPLELKSGYPVPRGLSRYSLEPKSYGFFDPNHQGIIRESYPSPLSFDGL